MFKANVNVRISPQEIARKFEKNLAGANGVQAIFANKVAMDTDEFVPMDQGTLASSVFRASNFEEGKIIYDMPYARRLYYGDEFRFDDQHHALATSRWFDWSKGINLPKWGEYAARLLGGVWRKI